MDAIIAKQSKRASIYRMVMPDHICPYGLKAKSLLERNGYVVEDRWLKTRAETDSFQQEQHVDTTPQIFIGSERIGGYDDLRRFFGKHVADKDGKSYRPVIAVFSIAILLSVSIEVIIGSFAIVPLIERFVALSMCLLALQKLQDVESFSTMFLNYDLLGRKWVPYAYLYPYGEALAGILMLAGVLTWLSTPIALFIGTVGAVSVIKAVYIDKRELKCACVGGNSNVPLGFVSLTENLMMVAMAIWMSLQGMGI
jgi:glutaredoxin